MNDNLKFAIVILAFLGLCAFLVSCKSPEDKYWADISKTVEKVTKE